MGEPSKLELILIEHINFELLMSFIVPKDA